MFHQNHSTIGPHAHHRTITFKDDEVVLHAPASLPAFLPPPACSSASPSLPASLASPPGRLPAYLSACLTASPTPSYADMPWLDTSHSPVPSTCPSSRSGLFLVSTPNPIPTPSPSFSPALRHLGFHANIFHLTSLQCFNRLGHKEPKYLPIDYPCFYLLGMQLSIT